MRTRTALHRDIAGAGRTRSATACPALRVELETPLDSAKAHVGDVFRFRTLDTVTLPAGLRIPAGSLGFGSSAER